jgi:uncharacterized protein
MISYLDTSAVVKLLLRDEGGAGQLRDILDASDRAVTSRITYPEARAALSAAARAGRLDSRQHTRAKRDLDRAVASVTMVELHAGVARAAGDITESFGLRAYDSVHLASALVVDEGDTVVVTWDRALATAASVAGLGVAPSA